MADAWPLLLLLLVIPVLMWLVDAIPGRAFYSRRAFEPPVRTYAELEAEAERVDWQAWEPTELYRSPREPVRRGLPASSGRELEPWP